MFGPEIFFELGNEIEVRWLETVFKVGEYLVGGTNSGGVSFLGWLENLEEEEWVGGWCVIDVEWRD